MEKLFYDIGFFHDAPFLTAAILQPETIAGIPAFTFRILRPKME